MILEDINPDLTYGDLLKTLYARELTLEEFTDVLDGMNIIVIQPDEIATTEIRGDCSRFFPEIKDGIVIGGKFQ